MRKRNWSEYNKNLVSRGSLTFFIHPSVIKKLKSKSKSKGAGRPQQFSDDLIRMLILIKIHYRLTYRALEGFIRCTLPSFIPGILVPTYSLICKRMKGLENTLPTLSNRRPCCVLLDASGLKVVGEGEWKVKVHGQGKRRRWIKVHIAVDAKTQEVVSVVSTGSNIHDGSVTETLLDQIHGKQDRVIADGAYDGKPSRDAIRKKGAEPIIPPRKDAVYNGNAKERDNAILEIKGLGDDNRARSIWKKLKGYHRRSLVETCFSRLKKLYGDRLFSKCFIRQKIESYLKFYLLNMVLEG